MDFSNDFLDQKVCGLFICLLIVWPFKTQVIVYRIFNILDSYRLVRMLQEYLSIEEALYIWIIERGAKNRKFGLKTDIEKVTNVAWVK